MRNSLRAYSEFKVGAAVRAPSSTIYVGANVENVAYPQGRCADLGEIGALVAAGSTAITAVAVVAEKVEVCPRAAAAAAGWPSSGPPTRRCTWGGRGASHSDAERLLHCPFRTQRAGTVSKEQPRVWSRAPPRHPVHIMLSSGLTVAGP